MAKIKKSTLTFLKQLSKNNDRDWFKERKSKYEAARANVEEFTQALLDKLSETDVLEEQTGRKAMHRIYRDTRFSKDKTPYKINLSASFTRDGKMRRGGYYFHVTPDGLREGDFASGSVAAGGFYNPEREDLKRIREELAADGSELRAIVADNEFIRVFGEMRGDQLKTSPKGYDREHENIDLLRYKNFYALRKFTEAEVLSAEYLDLNLEAYLTVRPFFDYFSDVLTTDANGERIV